MKRDSEELDGLVECLRVDDGYESVAPDCRQAVMARIAAPRWAPRPLWLYVCALVVVFAASVTLVVDRSRSPESTRIAAKQVQPKREPAEGPHAVPTQVVPEKAVVILPAPVATDVDKPTVRAPRPEARKIAHRPRLKRTAPVQELPVRLPAPRPDDASAAELPSLNPQLSTPNPPSRPIAAVAVTWPRADEGTDTSYSYVERDAETGTVTRCFVKREGNSIEIHLESTPGGAEEPPMKGCVDDGTTINA